MLLAQLDYAPVVAVAYPQGVAHHYGDNPVFAELNRLQAGGAWCGSNTVYNCTYKYKLAGAGGHFTRGDEFPSMYLKHHQQAPYRNSCVYSTVTRPL